MKTNTKKIKQVPDVLSIVQLSEVLQVSTKTTYQLIRDKKIASIKIGRAYRIPKISLYSYLKTAI